MEYLVLTGFTMLILMVLLVAAYNKMSSAEKQIDINAAERAVNRLKEACDFVYVHGHPSKLTTSIYLPTDVDSDNTFIDNSTINIATNVRGSHTDVWRSTLGEVGWDLEGSTVPSLSEGYYVLIVESTDYDSVYEGKINIHY